MSSKEEVYKRLAEEEKERIAAKAAEAEAAETEPEVEEPEEVESKVEEPEVDFEVKGDFEPEVEKETIAPEDVGSVEDVLGSLGLEESTEVETEEKPEEESDQEPE